MDISLLFNDSAKALKGRWGESIGVVLIAIVIQVFLSAIGFIFDVFGSVFFSLLLNMVFMLAIAPITYFGIPRYFLNIVNRQEAKIDNMFEGYKHFFDVVFTMIVVVLYWIFWIILFGGLALLIITILGGVDLSMVWGGYEL